MEALTKSGHQSYDTNVYNDFYKDDTKIYNGYGYRISPQCGCALIYLYEDGLYIGCREVNGGQEKYAEGWAKYFINELIQGNENT